MRLATVIDGAGAGVALVRDEAVLRLDPAATGLASMRDAAAAGQAGLDDIRRWTDTQPGDAWRRLTDVRLGPAVPEPGAIYTIGRNYRTPGEASSATPERPLVYGKLPSSVSGHGETVTWDRSLTPNVDAEVELGVVIGARASAVGSDSALDHVFGYTCVNDMSSRDAWLDGDQWLLGKSLAGFCPVGPWIVTADELPAGALRLGCHIDGAAIQDGSTADMRSSVAEVIAFLSRHVTLRPGDVVATGTPARLSELPGPDRHLEAGDSVTVWIEGIGELTTIIA